MRTVEVKSTIAGEIRDLPIEAGAWVETGELMALIEPDPNQSLQLYQKRSSVEQGKIDLAEQERNFERQKALFDRKMIPAKQFEEAEVRLTRARTGLRLAQLELDMLEAKANLQRVQLSEDQVALDEVRILAPIDGIVIRRDVEVGEVVSSGLSSYSGGTMLFEIGDPSQTHCARRHRGNRHWPGGGRPRRGHHRGCVSRHHVSRQSALDCARGSAEAGQHHRHL